MAAVPAAPVTAAPAPPLELGLLLLVDDDDEDDGPVDVVLLVTAAAAAAGAGAEDDEDDGVDDVSVPGVLSGAFGWPPSSGDGAILESVKRREIISGRQKPPRVAPSTGLYLVLRAALLRNLLLLLAAPAVSLSLCLALYQRYIRVISTLATSTCYFTATSCCCFCPSVFYFFTLLFGDFFFLRCCATATAH